MMVGATRMQVSVSSRMEVKIVMACFMRARLEALLDSKRVGAKIVNDRVTKKPPPSPFGRL